MKTISKITRISYLFIISIVVVDDFSCQESYLKLVNNEHIELEKISNDLANEGFGVEFNFDNLLSDYESIQLHILLKTNTGQIIPIQYKNIRKGLDKKLPDNTVALWFSQNWTENLPKNFFPSFLYETNYRHDEISHLTILCFGSKEYEYKWIPMERSEKTYWRMFLDDNRDILFKKDYPISLIKG